MLQLTVPFSADTAFKSPAEARIIQQTAFGFSTGWIQTSQYSQDPIVKIATFYQAVVARAFSSHISIVLNDFPAEKTSPYQQHLIYTLQTSSDL